MQKNIYYRDFGEIRTLSKLAFFNDWKIYRYIRKLVVLICTSVCFAIPTCAFGSAANLRVDHVVSRLDVGSHSVCEIVNEDGKSVSCVGKIAIVPSSSYNAWAINGNIFLTTRLIDISSDDELAFAIAHELAHVILGHSGSSIKNELEADYWAAKIMHRSGFNAASAGVVLGRLQTRRILSFPFSLISHPPNSRRMRTIRMAIEEEDFQDTESLKLQSGFVAIGLLSGLP